MQAQMTPATAPGIAGLMQGKPQGGPNPMQPTPASPGSVDQIKDTYGTKTVPRDMKALLALNEALAQVKSAENQNALQQQIPQQNIKDQMSAEAESIIQQARGVTDTTNQQKQQEQAALHRLTQGIARAPGANRVVPPQGLAGGGIVAFQSGGLSTGYAPDYTDARRFGIDLSPYDSPKVRAEKLERLRKMREFEKYMAENRAEIPREEPPVQPDTMQAEEQRLLGRFPKPQEAPPRAPAMPAPPQGMRPPAPPMRPSGPGIRGLGAAPLKPEGLGQGITMPQGSALPQGMQEPAATPQSTQAGVEALVQKAREDEQKRAMGVYGLTEEEKAPYLERIKQLQAPRPQEGVIDRLKAFVANMPARRPGDGGGILGGRGAQTSERLRLAEEAEEKQRRDALFDLQRKLGELGRGARVAGYESGVKGGEAAGARGLKGRELDITEAGVAERRRATDLQAETARLDRETREAIAKMDDKTRRFIADLQARTRQGGELNPDDLARIRANATKAVEESLMKDGRYLTLKQKDPAAAERQKQEAIEKMSRDLVQYARSGGATAASAAPAANTASNDPLGIRK